MFGFTGSDKLDNGDEGIHSPKDRPTGDERNEEEGARHVKGASHSNVHLVGQIQNPITRKTTELTMVVDQGQTVK